MNTVQSRKPSFTVAFVAFPTAMFLMILSGCGSGSTVTNSKIQGGSGPTSGLGDLQPSGGDIPAVEQVEEVANTIIALTPWSSGRVASGELHSCLINRNGVIWCAGNNGSGQLGNGGYTSSAELSSVQGLPQGMQMVAAGGRHTCALDADRGVWCWGSNLYGQLGDGSTSIRNRAVRVTGLSSGVRALALGNHHSCAVDDQGRVRCWGRNSNGQLGDGTIIDSKVPVLSALLSGGAQALALGAYHSCATDGAGRLWCWGSNANGILGDGTSYDRRAPVLVRGIAHRVVAMSLGYQHSCALDAQGVSWCWGSNQYGQLGNTSMSLSKTPVMVGGLAIGAQTIVSGGYHSCISDGQRVQCWGEDTYNQLGLTGLTTASRIPSPCVLGTPRDGVTDLAAGGLHSCVLSGDTYKCWGSDSNGQLALDGYPEVTVFGNFEAPQAEVVGF